MRLARVGTEFSLADPVALLFPDTAALEAHLASQDSASEVASEKDSRLRVAGQKVAGQEVAGQEVAGQDGGSAPAVQVRASVKALKRAQELGVDLSSFDGTDLVTVRDVELAAAAAAEVDYAALPLPLKVTADVRRVLLIGAGLGATQVIDILSDWADQQAVAIVDDGRAKWGQHVVGVPVVSGADGVGELFADGWFDAVIIAISTSVEARRRFREQCAAAGIPLANAIDRTAKVAATDVVLGQGNVHLRVLPPRHRGTRGGQQLPVRVQLL